MEQPKPKRLVLTSVNQLITLIRGNPALLTAFPSFAQLQNAPLSQSPKKSCNCGSKQNFTTPDANKQKAESLLSSLSADDFGKIKNILGLSELCYYKRSSSTQGLNLVCV